jgi:hypothetical protein
MWRTLPSADTVNPVQAETGWRPLNQETSGIEKKHPGVLLALRLCWQREHQEKLPEWPHFFQTLEKARVLARTGQCCLRRTKGREQGPWVEDGAAGSGRVKPRSAPLLSLT